MSINLDSSMPTRDWSQLDEACDQYIYDLARLDPLTATQIGLPGDEGGLPDLSPEGLEKVNSLDQGLLASLETTELRDKSDQITAAALRDRLGLNVELFNDFEAHANLNNIDSPIQYLRDIFSVMPTDSEEQWGNIISRLNGIPKALNGYRESLAYAANNGLVAAQRQVQIGVEQSLRLAGPESYFSSLVDQAKEMGISATEVTHLESAAATASSGYQHLASWLQDYLIPRAPKADAAGRDRYAKHSALFVGARVDLDETYEWGQDQLAQIDAEQKRIAESAFGKGTSIEEAMSRFDADPARQIVGKEALVEWLQSTADMAIRELNGTQFDIPEALQRIDCKIAPSEEGGIYYMAPTADLSRPGSMWWSVPPGDNVFHTWQERTTVFHEGVPGHHLQLGQAIYQSGTLNLWRRLGSWNSGHGEGWALYSEQLMADLGYQDDPADRMGMLDAQRLRATRVVLDIGLHLEKTRPDGNGLWDADYAWQFLRGNVASGSDAMMRFELDRYLGWFGQAPSYKIGQRLWEQLRDDYVAAHPADDSLRQFHSRALALGSLPLGTLREALLT